MNSAKVEKIQNEMKRFDEMKEYFSCDFENGVIIKIKNLPKDNKSKIGEKIGIIHSTGYVVFQFKKIKAKAHRYIFYMKYNFLDDTIDHINGIKHDNRITNLRSCPQLKNSQNIIAPKKNNTSGYLGVSWHKVTKKWSAQIGLTNNGKRRNIHLGIFNTPQEAHISYMKAKRELHEFCTI